MNHASITTDVQYALSQLSQANHRQWTGQGCVDELSRATDALERVLEALQATERDTARLEPTTAHLWQ